MQGLRHTFLFGKKGPHRYENYGQQGEKCLDGQRVFLRRIARKRAALMKTAPGREHRHAQYGSADAANSKADGGPNKQRERQTKTYWHR